MKRNLNNLSWLFVEKHYSVEQVEHKEDLFMSIIKEKDQEKHLLIEMLNKSKKEREILEERFNEGEKINEVLKLKINYLEKKFLLTKFFLIFLVIFSIVLCTVSINLMIIKFKYYKLWEKIKRSSNVYCL